MTCREEGLAFFGSLVAGQCHDVVNALNVINELAGLQQDVAAGAGKMQGAELAKLGDIAARIQSQVERAGGMVRDMNRFAHGAEVGVFDVGEALAVLLSLAARAARLKQARLVSQFPPHGVTMEASPWMLQYAVFACIEAALAGAHRGERAVRVGCASDGRRAKVEIESTHPFDEAQVGRTTDLLEGILRELKGSLTEMPDATTRRFAFVVPVAVQETSEDGSRTHTSGR
jgi:hypothetical protein